MDSIDDDIKEQENTIEMLEEDEDDLEFEKDYLNNLEEIAEQLAEQEEIIKDLKELKTDAYNIKQKALNKLNLSPITYHKFNDGSVRPMYRIGDYTFHGDTTEDYPNNVKIEKLDTISAENKLDDKEKITLNEALKIIKNTLDLSPGPFLNNTEIFDNRFSAKSTADSQKALQDTLKKNKALSEANKMLKIQMQLTNGRMISLAEANKVAKGLVNYYGFDKSVTEELKTKIFNAFAELDSASEKGFETIAYNEFMAELTDIGREYIENSEMEDTTVRDEFVEARNYIKDMRFRLSDDVKEQMRSNYGKGGIARQFFGKTHYVNDTNAPTLDDIYPDLIELAPSYFSAEDGSMEQPGKYLLS